jgi:MOSC domain-containing protein YiiM
MHDFATHMSAIELEQGLPDVLASPRETGTLDAIFVRPAANERRTLSEARLTPEGGIEGDRWVTEHSSDPRCQLSLMNARLLRQIAGDDDAMCFAGDNLIVDFDLGEENAPPGTQLAIGPDAVIELTDLPHTGCGKFAKRYGDDARAFVNLKGRQLLHLRGRYAKVIRGGTVRTGDTVRKLTRSQ